MTIPNITLLPTPVPSRADPTNFATRADAFLGALPTFGTELNAFATEANTLATDVQDNKDATDQTLLDMQALEVDMTSIYNSFVATSNFKGLWSSLTGALNKPASVYHNSNYWVLLNNLADVTASTPSDTNADWLKSLNSASGTTYDPSNTTLGSTTVQSAIERLFNHANYLASSNIVVNPDFRVSQDIGSSDITVPVSTQTYVCDQWYVTSGGVSANAKRISPQTGGLFIQVSTPGNTGVSLGQRIESLHSTNLDLSDALLHVKMSSNISRIVTWRINKPISTDNWSSANTIATGTFQSIATPTEFKIPISIVDTSLNGLEITLSFGSMTTSNASVTINHVQLRNADANTSLPFIPRPYQQELAMCQRYWETGVIGFNGGYQQGNASYAPYANFVVPKRTVPTMTLLNITSSNLTGFASTALSTNSFRYGGVAISTGSVVARADYIANARL